MDENTREFWTSGWGITLALLVGLVIPAVIVASFGATVFLVAFWAVVAVAALFFWN